MTFMVCILLGWGCFESSWGQSRCISSALESVIRSNRFNVERDFSEYSVDFSALVRVAPPKLGEAPVYRTEKLFEDVVFALKPDQAWMDAGAGEVKAIRGFHKLLDKRSVPMNRRPRTVAVAVHEPENKKAFLAFKASVSEEKFKSFFGRYIEKIPKKELGKFDVITDELGPMTYTKSPHVILNQYFSLLKKDGVLFVNLPEEAQIVFKLQRQRMMDPKIKGRVLSEEVRMVQMESLMDLFQNVSGIEAKNLTGDIWMLKKTQESVVVPEIKLVSLEVSPLPTGGAPIRGFVFPKAGIEVEDLWPGQPFTGEVVPASVSPGQWWKQVPKKWFRLKNVEM